MEYNDYSQFSIEDLESAYANEFTDRIRSFLDDQKENAESAVHWLVRGYFLKSAEDLGNKVPHSMVEKILAFPRHTTVRKTIGDLADSDLLSRETLELLNSDLLDPEDWEYERVAERIMYTKELEKALKVGHEECIDKFINGGLRQSLLEVVDHLSCDELLYYIEKLRCHEVAYFGKRIRKHYIASAESVISSQLSSYLTSEQDQHKRMKLLEYLIANDMHRDICSSLDLLSNSEYTWILSYANTKVSSKDSTKKEKRVFGCLAECLERISKPS